jgi:hypothetical protein
LSSRPRSGQLYYRDELDLNEWRRANNENWASSVREAVYDGLKYRRLLTGLPDADELDVKGRPMHRHILDLDALNETIQARLDRIEAGLKKDAPDDRESAQTPSGGPGRGPLDAASLRATVEEMLGPVAEHLHALHLESEFTFRLAYCVREFIKEYLVRPRLTAQGKESPAQGRDALIVRSLDQKIIAEQTEFDGLALEALRRILSGEIYKGPSDSAASFNAPAAPPAVKKSRTVCLIRGSLSSIISPPKLTSNF